MPETGSFIYQLEEKLTNVGKAITGWFTNPGKVVIGLNENVMQPVASTATTTIANIFDQIISPIKSYIILIAIAIIAALLIMRRLKI